MNDDRLTLAVGSSGSTRWGAGEIDAGRIPIDLNFTTSSPGGFKDLSCSLLRDLTPGPDEHLLDDVVAYGPGGQIAWEGRWLSLPRETGQGNRMTPQAVGHAAHLSDKGSVRNIFVDRTTNWGPPSLARRIAIATAGPNHLDGSSVTDLTWDIPDALPASDITERVYAAPAGVTIGKIMYRGARTGAFTNFEAPTLYASDDPDFNPSDSYTLTLDDTLRTQTLTTPRRYLMLRVATTAAVTPGGGHQQRFTQMAVYGNHGLTTQAITGEPDGLYVHDILADVLAAAPGLNYTTGAGGSITPNTSFAIPQAAYGNLTTAAAIIADVNKYFGWDWLVYDNKTFHYREAGSGVQWRARRSDGANLRLDGESSDVILNKLFVEYTDGFGNQRVAGPPGSGCDVEDALLEDTTLTHPVNSHGYDEKSDVLQLSQPTTDEGAILLGSVHLVTRNVANRRGQITLTGRVEHPTEGKVPVWRVRAGDSITVGDLAGDVPRRILATSYQHSSRTITLDLDNSPVAVPALLERLLVKVGGINI